MPPATEVGRQEKINFQSLGVLFSLRGEIRSAACIEAVEVIQKFVLFCFQTVGIYLKPFLAAASLLN